MSEGDKSEAQMYAAEFKDGQLQIVEMTPYTKADDGAGSSTHILPDMPTVDSGAEPKYMQVLDPEKGLVQLDLVNLTLVRCEDGDGEQSFRLVTNEEASEEVLDNTVTCIMEASEGEEPENQEEYVIVDAEQGPLMFLKPSPQQTTAQEQTNDAPEKPKLTPVEILEKAKALQKAKNELALAQKQASGLRRGRKRRGDLPPPQELLSSPNFKLFLYSCKMCNFKCNAIKELTAHKAAEHGTGAGRWRGGGGGGGCRVASTLQCARCPFRGTTHTQLMRHVQVRHLKQKTDDAEVYLNSAEAAAADILVCGACGFESRSRPAFKKHIEDAHSDT